LFAFLDDKIDLTFTHDEVADILPESDNRKRNTGRHQTPYPSKENKRGRSKSPHRSPSKLPAKKTRSRSRSRPRTPLKDFDGKSYKTKPKDSTTGNMDTDDDWDNVIVKTQISIRSTFHNGTRSDDSGRSNMISTAPPNFFINENFYGKLLKDAADSLTTEQPITSMLKKKWRVNLDDPVVTYEPLRDDRQSIERVPIPLTDWFKDNAAKPTYYRRVDGHGHFVNMFVTFNCFVTEVLQPAVPAAKIQPPVLTDNTAANSKEKFCLEQFQTNQPALKLAMDGFDEIARKYPFTHVTVVTEKMLKLLMIYRKQCAFPDDPDVPQPVESVETATRNSVTYADWQRQQPSNQQVWRDGSRQPQQGGQPHRGGQPQRRSGSRGRGHSYDRQSSTNSNGSSRQPPNYSFSY